MNKPDTRASWDAATRAHNGHKGDQAAFLRDGGDTLFPEELALLGDLDGKRLAHLQCNSGQDSLCLARRGALVTGVDFSGEAIAFARRLSSESHIDANFVEAELCDWMETCDERFDLAFASYGTVGWLPDLNRWARGIQRILTPGGRFVLVEFHPLIWSFDEKAQLTRDDYFQREPFLEPVGDYVAESGASLGGVDGAEAKANTIIAESYQYSVAETVSALCRAGLALQELHEWPHSNGCRFLPLVAGQARQWVWPEGTARLPLMYGIAARC